MDDFLEVYSQKKKIEDKCGVGSKKLVGMKSLSAEEDKENPTLQKTENKHQKNTSSRKSGLKLSENSLHWQLRKFLEVAALPYVAQRTLDSQFPDYFNGNNYL